MQHGENLQFLLDRAEDEGKPPPALLDRPSIRDDLLFIWRAFTELTTSRRLGMGSGYIPLSEMVCYCRLYSIQGEDREMLIRVLYALDIRFIELTQEKNAATKKP